MQIKKNLSSYTVTPESTDLMLVYSHPYITDGHCVVNLDADRITVKCIGEFKDLIGQLVKDKTPFNLKLTDEGYVSRSIEGVDLSQAFNTADHGEPIALTPFVFSHPDTGEPVSLLAQGESVIGLHNKYAALLEGNPATCATLGGLIISYRNHARKGRFNFAAVAPVKLSSIDDEDLQSWLSKLGEVR